VSLFLPRFFAPKVHQNQVHGKPVQPGVELAIAAKRSDLANQVNEDFVS
jgi:hypothetical protein